MSTIMIELDDEQLTNLKSMAAQVGLKAEELASEIVAQHTEPFPEDFTPEQRAAIEAGLEDVEKGRTIPHEQVMAEARRRLGK